MLLSVVVPTHNPDRQRLARVLAALSKQTLPATQRETIIIDNRSDSPVTESSLPLQLPASVRIVAEAELGLTPARIRGIREAAGEIVVFVDDDNLLAPDYLTIVGSEFSREPRLGACGGRVLPEFETKPPQWIKEFWRMLALRDLGSAPLKAAGGGKYPECAPVGAGMAVRRDLALDWAAEVQSSRARIKLDRSGGSLASGGDNDLVLTILKRGFEVKYVPQLDLTHIIPAKRTTTNYLARLNYASSKTWARLLHLHGISEWRPLSRAGAVLRKLRAFFTLRAWHGPVEYIRWRGACGNFDGRIRDAFSGD